MCLKLPFSTEWYSTGGYITFCLPINPLRDSLIVSTFSYEQCHHDHSRTNTCSSPCFQFSEGTCSEVELLGHMVTLCLTSWRIPVPFSTEAAPFHFPASSAQEFQCVDIFAKNFFQNFIYLFLSLAVLGLCCRKQAFSGFGEWGVLSSCDVQASYCSGFSCLQSTSSTARGLGAQALLPCGMWNLPSQGLNLCLLQQQMDSYTGPPGMSIVCVCLFLNNSHPHGYEMVSDCVFDWHFPNDSWCSASFHVLLSLSSFLLLCFLKVFVHKRLEMKVTD